MSLKVAIVGRPNVGKSTLFNRLAGKKLAIVNDQPGVTRDRREAEGRLGDLDLELIDTAGFEDVADESLEARMRAQTERAIEDADVCLFVIDGREGVTPLDRIFGDLVRRRNRPVILLANKAEGKAADVGAAEAFGLGLGEALAISGEHGEGMSELYEALRQFEPEDVEDEDAEDENAPLRIAIVGRPNAGKSTLVNRLIGEDRLLTGPEAGITRDAIPVDWEYDGRPIRLVDTAGLRKRARVQETLEKLSTADTIRAITFRRGGDPGDGRRERLRDPGYADRRSGGAGGAGSRLLPRQVGPRGGAAGASCRADRDSGAGAAASAGHAHDHALGGDWARRRPADAGCIRRA